MRYAGLDVGKESLTVSILTESGDEDASFTVPNKHRGWTQLAERLDEEDLVGLEAGTYAYPVAEHLMRAGFEVRLGHPKRIHAMIESDTKTDQRDSWHLADLLRVDRFPLAFHPDPELFRARDVIRRRMDKGQAATRLKNQIRSVLDRYGVEIPSGGLWTNDGMAWLKEPKFGDERDTLLREQVEELKQTLEHQEALEDELALIAEGREDVRRLLSLEGMGIYLALLVILETGPIERFGSIAKYRAYAGGAPRVEQSGETEETGKRREANQRLKWAFGLVTGCLIRSRRDNPVKQYYRKQKAKVSMEVQARARARRKVVNIVYAMLRKEEPCRWRDKNQWERKVTKLERRARRARA